MENINFNEMTDNQLVKWVDYEYKCTIAAVIQKTLLDHPSVPIVWEDIYYEFLFKSIILIRDYNPDANVAIKTYIGLKCKFFTQNYCRTFESSKFRILNYSTQLEDYQFSKEDWKQDFDSFIDASVLNEEEFSVYELLFIYDYTMRRAAEELDMKLHIVRTLRDSILLKLKGQIKN